MIISFHFPHPKMSLFWVEVFSRLVFENTPICLYSRCGLSHKNECRIITFFLLYTVLLTEPQIPWTETSHGQFIQSVSWTLMLVAKRRGNGDTHHWIHTLWKALCHFPYKTFYSEDPKAESTSFEPLQGWFYRPKEALYTIIAKLHDARFSPLLLSSGCCYPITF